MKHGDAIVTAIERTLFASRWLQLPLLGGLLIALVALEIEFALDVITSIASFGAMSRLDAILLTLDLIDMVLIANLVVMVVLSGYKIFITGVGYPSDPEHQSFKFDEAAGPLKFRIATTIILISTIHMLHAFLDDEPLPTAMIVQLGVFQTLFLLTAVVLAVVHRIIPHGPRRSGQDDPTNEPD